QCFVRTHQPKGGVPKSVGPRPTASSFPYSPLIGLGARLQGRLDVGGLVGPLTASSGSAEQCAPLGKEPSRRSGMPVGPRILSVHLLRGCGPRAGSAAAYGCIVYTRWQDSR